MFDRCFGVRYSKMTITDGNQKPLILAGKEEKERDKKEKSIRHFV